MSFLYDIRDFFLNVHAWLMPWREPECVLLPANIERALDKYRDIALKVGGNCDERLRRHLARQIASARLELAIAIRDAIAGDGLLDDLQ